MKIEINYNDVHETIEARDADDALARLKTEASKRAPLMLRAVIKSLGNVAFGQEAVKRHNAQTGRQDPLPRSSQDFLDWAIDRGYAKVIEP